MMWRAILSLFLFVTTVVVASCSSLIGADDYEDSAEAICGMISVCYGDDPSCPQRLRDRLSQAPAPVRSQWLTALTDASCLNSCSVARHCLDLIPICAQGGACDGDQSCCGFLTGSAKCEGPENGKKCCGSLGTSCTDDSECCKSARGCSQATRTCGGVVCRALGKECVNSFDCCSNRCVDARCVEVCSAFKFDCTEDSDCCSGYCDPDARRCATPPCKGEGQDCSRGGACCKDPLGMTCQTMVIDQSLRCVTDNTCFPAGVPCERDEHCCSHICVLGVGPDGGGLCSKPCTATGGSCNATDKPCCSGECRSGTCEQICGKSGAACATGAECCSELCKDNACDCSTGACVRDENCCTGQCIGGACKPACGALSCDHSECQAGGRLEHPGENNVLVECAGTATFDPACVKQVCDEDPYCCCGAWDFLCVTEAAQKCGGC
jgi:hypothetical protein